MKKNKFLTVIITATLLATPFTAVAATEKLSVDKKTADYVTINSDGSQYFVFAIKRNEEEPTNADTTQQDNVAVQDAQQTSAQSTQSSGNNTQQNNSNANQSVQSAQSQPELPVTEQTSTPIEQSATPIEQSTPIIEQPAQQPAAEQSVPTQEQPASEPYVYYTTGDGQTFDNAQDASDWAMFNDTNYSSHVQY